MSIETGEVHTFTHNFECISPDENFKKELGFLKAVREKTLTEFKTQLYNVVVSESDDPPVLGTRLDLSDEVVDIKPKLKNKKKK